MNEYHLFQSIDSRETLCHKPLSPDDWSLKKYDQMEREAQTGTVMSSLHADRALAQICKMCMTLADAR